MLHPALNIKNYIADGFEKVCDVEIDEDIFWRYTNINESLMFDPHKSWAYAITAAFEIMKVGETGNPLGIKMINDDQPKCGTQGRVGRYRRADRDSGTDGDIRRALMEHVRLGCVSIWAKRCPIVEVDNTIAGNKTKTILTLHETLEKQMLDYIYEQTGGYPKLNKCRK